MSQFTDQATKRWVAQPPAHNQVKLFLLLGEGSSLLTLTVIDEGTTRIDCEPNPPEIMN
jgi:hypothetical protein